jgi:hypothetical protein
LDGSFKFDAKEEKKKKKSKEPPVRKEVMTRHIYI